MPTDTLEHLQEQTQRVGKAQRKNRRAKLQKKILELASALIALASETLDLANKNLDTLLNEIRAAAEEMRSETEADIAATLNLADSAVRVWQEMWEAALTDPAKDRTDQANLLRWVLKDAEQNLREALNLFQDYARISDRPLARLEELEARVAEFPLWSRECLARWEMLDCPWPPLDSEQIASVEAAYARGEYEDVSEVLSRVRAGGPWVKE